MRLTAEEKKMLRGEQGRAVQELSLIHI